MITKTCLNTPRSGRQCTVAKPFEMDFRCFFVLMFLQMLLCKIGQANDLGVEDTVAHLQQKITQVEERLSSLESAESSDQLSVAVREAGMRILEGKNELLARLEGVETKARDARNDLSVRLDEVEKRSSKREEEIAKRVSEVEMRCAESTTDISARLQDAEVRFLRMDSHLLVEVQEAREKSSEAFERVRIAEQEAARALESDIWQVEMNETLEMFSSFVASHRDTEDVTRKEISSSNEKQFNDRLESLTTKMRIFEDSLLEIEKNYANVGFVSRLDQSLRHLDEATKADIRAIQSELPPRVEQLEERCGLCQDVAELNKTLRNHTFQISALNADLLEVQKRCDGEPPAVPNGKTIRLERKHGSKVQYECDGSHVLTSHSTVHCNRGDWEGQPPVCSFFDATFYLMTYTNGVSIVCYSVDNHRKIDFSRVLDTGLGARLTGVVGRGTGYAYLYLGYLRSAERFASFQCGFGDGRGAMNIVLQTQNVSGGLYFADPFRVADTGDTLELEVKFKKTFPLRWRHNGVDVPSWNDRERVDIPSVRPSDAGTYEGQRGETAPALLRLIVRKCKKNVFGEHCDQTCPPCYNGGICHDYLGVCVCPPGFNGNNCEVACGGGRHGADCSRHCSECRTFLFCRPDPYGCSCAPGWKGLRCDERCETGWYGADCKQPCHCALGSEDCETFSGVCSGGCSRGWTGQSCQIPVAG